MAIDTSKVIGNCIQEVRYSEVNNRNGPFYFDGFDVVDCGVWFRMDNGHVWSFRWTDDEIFELVAGAKEHAEILEDDKVKTWDASAQWTRYRDQPVQAVRISFFDEAAGLVERCVIAFEDGSEVSLVITEGLGPNEVRPVSSAYAMGGSLYVIYDQRLLEDIDANRRDEDAE